MGGACTGVQVQGSTHVEEGRNDAVDTNDDHSAWGQHLAMKVEPNHIPQRVLVFGDPSYMAQGHIAGDGDDTPHQGVDQMVVGHKPWIWVGMAPH
jgi:hypothetical protein